MKYVKMLGLAAIAAAALMAYVGAGTASATALCSTSTSPCTGTKYGVGTEIRASLHNGQAVLTAIFATVKCSESLVVGEVTNAGGASATVVGKITTLAFGTCNCTVTVLANGELEVHYTSAGNGTLTGKNSSVTIDCSGVKCIFGTAAAGTTIGTVTGGNGAIITANANLPYISGDASNFVCTAGSGIGIWKAPYEAFVPSSLFISAS
jgi:hypothetical protein